MIIQQLSISEGFRGVLLGKYEKYVENQRLKIPVLFCKYLRNKSSDLHEILCGGQLLSCELKF